jgi:hypothetical protein
MSQDHHREEVMPTYIWCKECHQLRSKELLHEDCEPNLHTKKAIEDARIGRTYNDLTTLDDEPQWIENWYA